MLPRGVPRLTPRPLTARLAVLLATLLASTLTAPAIAGAVLLPGAAVQVPVFSLREVRFATTVRQRYDFSCGSAALATLLSFHYGMPVSEQAVFEAMLGQGDAGRIRQEGFSLLDMKRLLEARGFQADGFRQPLTRLAEAGLPAIALISDNGYRHFVVVKGVRDGRVLLGDPSAGTRVVTVAAFEAMWVNQLLFLIHSHREQARFNAPQDWRFAPPAPLSAGLVNDGLAGVAMPKLGSTDF